MPVSLVSPKDPNCYVDGTKIDIVTKELIDRNLEEVVLAVMLFATLFMTIKALYMILSTPNQARPQKPTPLT